jgi:hypothetical protein
MRDTPLLFLNKGGRMAAFIVTPPASVFADGTEQEKIHCQD